jgi:glycine dehydrogenase
MLLTSFLRSSTKYIPSINLTLVSYSSHRNHNLNYSSLTQFNSNNFSRRHIGPCPKEEIEMLKIVGCSSLEDLVEKIVPNNILRSKPLQIGNPLTETQALDRLRAIANENNYNVISLLGTGFYGTNTPPVIMRILDNPEWTTPYTPYQAEISQGRLRALLIYQTMIIELTGLEISNASLLDEATASAEAMNLAHNWHKKKRSTFLVSNKCHPQNLAVLKTRAEPLGIKLKIVDDINDEILTTSVSGLIVQYPTTDGVIFDYTDIIKKAKEKGIITICIADLLALTLIKSPGEMGFDIAVGTSQRFGVQPGFGGPSAAYMSTIDKFKRVLPGRIVGVSKDVYGNEALRLSLQTREQHIKREKATSNICTSQALLANMAGFYAVYHGPDGLKDIATTIHEQTKKLSNILTYIGYNTNSNECFFDTIKLLFEDEIEMLKVHEFMESNGVNIRKLNNKVLTLSLDESITDENLSYIIQKFSEFKNFTIYNYKSDTVKNILEGYERESSFLTHPIFNRNRSETNMTRYLKELSSKDMGLSNSMIPLGSCTMKLNSAAEMVPITWPGFSKIHPFAPSYQREGYIKMFRDIERDLANITGFATVSLQPNAGSQGEYTGLRMINKYHEDKGEYDKKICLIPSSSHGTNPASAHIAGMEVVTIKVNECDGQIDAKDLESKCEKYKDKIGAIMITYPSTYGIYDDNIKDICKMVHSYGGQVYLDGANMNAQIGITSPGDIGADVCHLNLHKSFCVSKGTLVKLPSGLEKKIEDLSPIENIITYDLKKSIMITGKLRGKYQTGNKECIELTFGGNRKLTCTPDHFILTANGWLEAKDIYPGNNRVIAISEEYNNFNKAIIHLGIISVKNVGIKEVYDITVAEHHNFLANGIVVHNCIPHGGGGPGMGPVCVASHLIPYLPTHPLVKINGTNNEKSIGSISSSPWGSAGILPIVWMYIKMMGNNGLEKASQIAMLNANYMAKKLESHYKILYKGKNNLVAHEFIIDLKEFNEIGITEDDIAKRLMDYNFHSPTMSWPVPRSLMIEPTESESKDELDRFIDAMISIKKEIEDIDNGIIDLADSPLKKAPHTLDICTSSNWDRKYSREQACYPLIWLKQKKIWPSVSRIDHINGDRNLICSYC